MKRVFLHYKGEYVHLPDGETVVGRDLVCRLRFNDPAVSRKHFRITVDAGTAMLEDLGSTNGTRLNREPLQNAKRLEHHDTIQLGGRELTVHFLDEEGDEADGEISTLVDQPAPRRTPPPIEQALAERATRTQTCSQCGAAVDPDDEHCRACGYDWSDFRAHTPTLIGHTGEDRRRHPRQPVDIPVLYSSDTLEVQSVAKNLSLSGVFVSTEFLDAVGTGCRVVVMVDGGPAVELVGRVTRVVKTGHPDGVPPGLGIEFESMDQVARQWLWRTLRHQLGNLGQA